MKRLRLLMGLLVGSILVITPSISAINLQSVIHDKKLDVLTQYEDITIRDVRTKVKDILTSPSNELLLTQLIAEIFLIIAAISYNLLIPYMNQQIPTLGILPAFLLIVFVVSFQLYLQLSGDEMGEKI